MASRRHLHERLEPYAACPDEGTVVRVAREYGFGRPVARALLLRYEEDTEAFRAAAKLFWAL